MYTRFKVNGDCKRFMSLAASSLLTTANKELCMKKFQRMSVKQGTQSTQKRAAVLVPICVENDEVSLLYTLRAASLRSHRGQVSFPGGMADSKDASLEHTALRETQEELGIKMDKIDIWGSGQPIIRQDISVLPIVGRIKDNFSFRDLYLNSKEVEEVFTVPIKRLVDPKYHRHTQFRGSYTTPTYLGGPYRIWGLTSVITFMFLKSLVSRNFYDYHISYIPDVDKIVSPKICQQEC